MVHKSHSSMCYTSGSCAHIEIITAAIFGHALGMQYAGSNAGFDQVWYSIHSSDFDHKIDILVLPKALRVTQPFRKIGAFLEAY